MTKTFDTIQECTRTIKSISNGLERLADAFYDTGNEKVADRLFKEAHLLRESAEQIYSAYTGENAAYVNQSIRDSQRFIGSIMTGLLDGKGPKDACIEAFPHHFDKDIIDRHENKDKDNENV